MNRPVACLVSLAVAVLSGPGRARNSALHTEINGPHHIAIDSSGNLYVSEEYGERILKLDPEMTKVSVIAGNGRECCRQENVPARKSSIYSVYSIAPDRNRNLYIAGRNAKDGAFVRIVHEDSGRIETLARGEFPGRALGVKASDANLSDPKGMVVTPEGKLLVSADESHIVVELGRTVGLVAGTERHEGFSGDGGPASLARFDLPGAMAIDAHGNIFVADYFNHRIRRIDGQTGTVTTVAGNGGEVSSGEGQAATDAGVPYPYALAVDSLGDLFVVENGAFKVRRVDARSRVIRTIAGTGRNGFSGDGGPAIDADMNPVGIAIDEHGNLYIADLEHNRVRRVDGTTGIISTVAGNGLPHRKIIIE
jgi:DNA-binding beta-propeller fold protein YncE